jgi:hypothetical protein
VEKQLPEYPPEKGVTCLDCVPKLVKDVEVATLCSLPGKIEDIFNTYYSENEDVPRMKVRIRKLIEDLARGES